MWFATKPKVNDALVQFVLRSTRIEKRISVLQETMKDGTKMFGSFPELDELQNEVAEYTESLALITAAVHSEQATPKQAARFFPKIDIRISDYEKLMLSIEQSYQVARLA